MLDPRIERLFEMLNELEKTVDAGSKANEENDVDKEFELSVQMLTQTAAVKAEFDILSKDESLFGSYTLEKVQKAVQRIETKMAHNANRLMAELTQPKAKA